LLLLTACSKPGCWGWGVVFVHAMISGLYPVFALLGFSPVKVLLQAEWLGRHCHSAPEALCSRWSL